jgi:hypothetical protein
MTQLNLPDGWTPVSCDAGMRLAQNLASELGPQHVLAGVTAIGVARRQDCDDVLFRLDGHRCAYALVHLTWQKWRRGSNPKFPGTVLCEREEDLVALLENEA